MNWEEQLGVKISVLVSGVIGGIISLTFEQKISFAKALVMIFTGGVTAAVTYPALESYFTVQPAFANGLGFFLGLISMRVIDITLSLVDRIKANPVLIVYLLNPAKYGELFGNPKRDTGDDDTVDNSVYSTGSVAETSEEKPTDPKDIHLL